MREFQDGVMRAYWVARSEGKDHEGAVNYVCKEKGLIPEMVKEIVRAYTTHN